MMFEVQDLAVASPATVSRCGMVYLEPSILGLQPFINCWVNNIPGALVDQKKKLLDLFERFLRVNLELSFSFSMLHVLTRLHGVLILALIKILVFLAQHYLSPC